MKSRKEGITKSRSQTHLTGGQTNLVASKTHPKKQKVFKECERG